MLIRRLLELGAQVKAHDPEAMENVRAEMGDKIHYCDQPMDTLEDVDGLAIVTEWSQFRTPDFEEMKSRMKQPVVFDGRNLYDPQVLAEQGFTYYSIGRPVAGG